MKCDLPSLDHWYGLAMALTDRSLSEEAITQKKQEMTRRLISLLPSAICLSDEVFSMFCLLPCRTEA